MERIILCATLAIGLALVGNQPVFADDGSGTVHGAEQGAVRGGLVGGPHGAAVGAGVGAATGTLRDLTDGDRGRDRDEGRSATPDSGY